jgi:hypothetical protein
VLISAVPMPLADVPASKVSPGWLGLAVVVLLGIATWLLIRSMNKQLKKIDFDERDTETGKGGDGGARPPDGGETSG